MATTLVVTTENGDISFEINDALATTIGATVREFAQKGNVLEVQNASGDSLWLNPTRFLAWRVEGDYDLTKSLG